MDSKNDNDLIAGLSKFAPKTFAKGWSKLPDELELEVLHHCLPTQSNLKESFFPGVCCWKLADQPKPEFNTELLPCLACPATKDLATEIIYRENKVHVHIRAGQGVTKYFGKHDEKNIFPQTHAWQYIRTLAIECEVSVSALKTLVKLLGGSMPMSSMLQDVEVTISGIELRDEGFVEMLESLETFKIRARRLKVTYLHNVNGVFLQQSRSGYTGIPWSKPFNRPPRRDFAELWQKFRSPTVSPDALEMLILDKFSVMLCA